jgi:Holliday junction resolvase RusA-like endonuclease
VCAFCFDPDPGQAIPSITGGSTYFMTLPLIPVTKKNNQRMFKSYRTGKSFPVQSKRYLEYEREADWYLPRLDINYPINLKAIYYIEARRIVDITNLNSALHDVLVKCGVIADDNCRIVVSTDGSRVRWDKDDPRTEIWIEQITDKDVLAEVAILTPPEKKPKKRKTR